MTSPTNTTSAMAKITSRTPVSLITGGSRGLGREIVGALLDRGHIVVTNGRRAEHINTLRDRHGDCIDRLHTLVGDITDADHRRALRDMVNRLGRLDLLVNNASTLGATPLPQLGAQDSENLLATFETNVLAPHELTTTLLPILRATRGTVVNVTSDAAVEAYPGWGAYAASKAALEQWSHVLSVEEPDVSIYWVDPGDLRTDLHQQAFPGEDISDRPLPQVAIPGLLTLLDTQPPSGRFRLQELVVDSFTDRSVAS